MASSKSKEVIKITGYVALARPDGHFDVKLENGHTIDGYVSGNMRRHFIRLVQGDWVEVELTPYDLTKGRIIFRHNEQPKRI